MTVPTTSAKPWVLGVSSGFHNGAACLLKGDEIVVAVQEERLSRIKRDRVRIDEPSLAVKYCLDAANIRAKDLSLVVDCSIDWAGTKRKSNPSDGSLLHAALGVVEVISIPHHFGHAISAFATSGFRESAILVIDGGGSPGSQLPNDERQASIDYAADKTEHLSIYRATGDGTVAIEKHLSHMPYLAELWRGGMPRFASLGHMYSSVAWQIFGDYMEAGKVMGLAPYAAASFPVSDFLEYAASGTFNFFDTVPRRFPHMERWPARQGDYQALAASVQDALEYALQHIVEKMVKMEVSRNLCYAGGVALNSVANHKVFKRSAFENVHIIPAAEDSGPAIGAAYHGLHLLTRRNHSKRLRTDFLGRDYSSIEIAAAIKCMPGLSLVPTDDALDYVVELLCAGKVVGWFQGGAEFGPRSLGHRSILYDARRADAKDVINGKVKHREEFRPFAPSILAERVGEWFDTDVHTQAMDFMLEICPFKSSVAPSAAPGVIHVGHTGRLQSVRRDDNPRFHRLIEKFFAKTGVPLILNTSMNVMGEPIVETPTEALWLLLSTGVEYCVLGDQVATKAAAFRSVLDLVPRCAGELISTDDKVSVVRVETPHGPRIYRRVPSSLVSIWRQIDGNSTGWELFKDLRGTRQQQYGAWALGQLFRYRLIDFENTASEATALAS